MRDVEKDIFIVYRHTNMINDKIYIGITSNSLEVRSGSNGINYKSNRHFWSAIQIYGWNNFKHEVLFSNLTKEEACEIEIELIAFYKSNLSEFGYNKSIGGELSALGCTRIQTKEIREKISDSVSKHIICLDNLKTYKSARIAGKVLNLDYKYISRVLNGQAKSCHGYHFLFLKDYNANKTYNLYNRNKKIICLETNQTFESISECAREMNLSKGNIGHVLSGRRKSYHNLHFKYYLGE